MAGAIQCILVFSLCPEPLCRALVVWWAGRKGVPKKTTKVEAETGDDKDDEDEGGAGDEDEDGRGCR